MTEPHLIQREKSRLRAEVRAKREAMSKDTRADAVLALTSHLIALATSLRVSSLTCYLATPTEPETRPFLTWARDQGIRVLLPVASAGGVLSWVAAEWVGADGDLHTVTGRFGIEEPVGTVTAAPVDLMVVPACAVDGTGRRLGWGLGYFDRALAALPHRPPVYALVYDSEVLDALPAESHDIPVTGVITPTRIITCE